MSNVFFTSFDGTVWVNKAHIKEVIEKTLDCIPKSGRAYGRRFVFLLTAYLDTLEYVPEDGIVDEYFHCKTCDKDFPVRYTPGTRELAKRPCPTCGHDASPKKEERSNESKCGDNTCTNSCSCNLSPIPESWATPV